MSHCLKFLKLGKAFEKSNTKHLVLKLVGFIFASDIGALYSYEYFGVCL